MGRQAGAAYPHAAILVDPPAADADDDSSVAAAADPLPVPSLNLVVLLIMSNKEPSLT